MVKKACLGCIAFFLCPDLYSGELPFIGEHSDETSMGDLE